MGGYIGELKDNYVYIFVRERNMKYWIRRFTVRFLSEILFYQAAAAASFCGGDMFTERGVYRAGAVCFPVFMPVCEDISFYGFL